MTAPRFITTRDGVRIAYASCGSGSPLVFVRGWISDLEVFWEEPRFRAYIETLARHFTVVRYDGRGNGLSQRLVRNVSLEALLLDLEGVVEGLGLGELVLYGSTFGGPVAMLYAARRPEQVRRLILEGTYASGRGITTRLRQLFITMALRYFPEMAFLLLGYATQPDEPQAAFRRPERVQQVIAPAMAAQLYRLAFKVDVRSVLPDIKAPTLVLHRTESQSIPVRLGREVAALIPGARFVALSGVAHNLWEGDAQAALTAIGEFLGLDLTLATPPPADRVPAGAVGGAAGATISHYRLGDLVSEGRLGVVYRAVDTRLGRPVVLKLLPPDLARTPEGLERFRREVRAASRLNHPNICTVYDVGDDARGPFMVLESLEGQTLKQTIGGRSVPLARLLDWAIQAADALAAAHSAGIVHRDIKPTNLFVTSHGHIKVLDFGIAKLADPVLAEDTTREALTGAGIPIGTVAYMSPEQARGEPVDARTDLFSLGVVLYEMATGRLPFEGDSLPALLDHILGRRPDPAAVLNPDLPPDLDRVISKALEKDRDLRYQSASDLKADLLRLQRALQSGPPDTPGGAEASQPA